MSGYRVEYTISAQEEIRNIYYRIRDRNPQGAVKWREDLIARIESLATYPLRHPAAAEGERFQKEIRLMLLRKRHSQFRIYYTVDRKRVVILAVRRSTRKALDADELKS